MDFGDLISWLISWLAVVLAFVSAQRARGYQQDARAASEEANRIQAELLQLERSRHEREEQEKLLARFWVNLETHRDFTDVVIGNRGPGDARNVRVAFKGGSRTVESTVQNPPQLPVPLMKAGATLPLRLSAPRAIVGKWVNPVVIEWEHADGSSDSFETTVA